MRLFWLAALFTTFSFTALAATETYCDGHTKSDTWGTYYPNGAKTHDNWGTYYPNGKVPFDNWGLYYPNGKIVKDNWGTYYPNGQKVYDNWGCYDPQGKDLNCSGDTIRVAFRLDSSTRIHIGVNRKDGRILPMEFEETLEAGILTYTVDFNDKSIHDVDLECEY